MGHATNKLVPRIFLAVHSMCLYVLCRPRFCTHKGRIDSQDSIVIFSLPSYAPCRHMSGAIRPLRVQLRRRVTFLKHVKAYLVPVKLPCATEMRRYCWVFRVSQISFQYCFSDMGSVYLKIIRHG